MSDKKIKPLPLEAPTMKRRHAITFTQPSKTQQQFKAAVDVNNIVRHYAQTGLDPYEKRKLNMNFGTVPNLSYTEAMFHVAQINSAFYSLSAQTRAAYHNDPQRWIDQPLPTPLSEEIVDPDALQSVTRDPGSVSSTAPTDESRSLDIT